MSEPAEGRYADPSGANQLRWWDDDQLVALQSMDPR